MFNLNESLDLREDINVNSRSTKAYYHVVMVVKLMPTSDHRRQVGKSANRKLKYKITSNIGSCQYSSRDSEKPKLPLNPARFIKR